MSVSISACDISGSPAISSSVRLQYAFNSSCDFSYINKVELKFEYFEDVLNKYKNIKLQIYGLSYNILKTENGKGIIKFET